MVLVSRTPEPLAATSQRAGTTHGVDVRTLSLDVSRPDTLERIRELSKITGVSISTIRLYEREGLIAPASRTEGKFREFTPEQERWLNFIKRVRNLGFSFNDVKVMLAMSDASAEPDAEEVIERIRSGISMRKSDLTNLDRQLKRALEGKLTERGLVDAFFPAS